MPVKFPSNSDSMNLILVVYQEFLEVFNIESFCNYSEFTLSPRASRICAFSGWSEGSSCLKSYNLNICIYVPVVPMLGCFFVLFFENASHSILNE